MASVENIHPIVPRKKNSVLHANALDSAVRWQYIIGTGGPHVEYPAHAFPVHKRRHWGPFLAAALPHKRRVMILIDAGLFIYKNLSYIRI